MEVAEPANPGLLEEALHLASSIDAAEPAELDELGAPVADLGDLVQGAVGIRRWSLAERIFLEPDRDPVPGHQQLRVSRLGGEGRGRERSGCCDCRQRRAGGSGAPHERAV